MRIYYSCSSQDCGGSIADQQARLMKL